MGKNSSAKRIDWTQLYGIPLRKEDREALGMRMEVNIYVQDPFIAKERPRLGKEKIGLDREPGLFDGPTSSRIAVVDYNVNTNITAKPVEWDVEKKEFLGVNTPKGEGDESDSVFFHQVNVWGIIQNIIAFFEDPHVMGRPIPWAFNGNRLIVVPHAGQEANSSYDRKGKCLVFGYFEHDGDPVYTCLSHDIVAHETGHAILDGIRPYYLRFSSLQTAAFHEFIADFTSILSVLKTRKVRHVVADTSEDDLRSAEVIANLAEEFAIKKTRNRYRQNYKQYLRRAINPTKMKQVENGWNYYHCSEVLTGAMYDILAETYKLRIDNKYDSNRAALKNASQSVNRLAFRALDYCPPVDIQFADYFQALISANEIAYPVDTLGYKKIIKETFKDKGIKQIDPLEPPQAADLIWKYGLNSIATSRTAAYHFLNDNRDCFDIPENQDFEIADLYYTNKIGGGNRKLPKEIILEYIWTESVDLKGSDFRELEDKRVPLLCGGTIVFEEHGNIVYRSRKPGTQLCTVEGEGKQRVEALLAYIKKLIALGMIKRVTDEVLEYVNLDQTAIPDTFNKDLPDMHVDASSRNEELGQKCFCELVREDKRIEKPTNISSFEFHQLRRYLKSSSIVSD
ncbi:MAG: hypothetical protein JSV05_05215 [Candidatus Bathyarchaeota archaeon]|nr:MAG: hypothetical protein JSV05_05215 [Candidatus Bathyarchaeota archaeon]